MASCLGRPTLGFDLALPSLLRASSRAVGGTYSNKYGLDIVPSLEPALRLIVDFPDEVGSDFVVEDSLNAVDSVLDGQAENHLALALYRVVHDTRGRDSVVLEFVSDEV